MTTLSMWLGVPVALVELGDSLRDSMPRFCFGVNSCELHQEAARDAGIPMLVMQRRGIATDVDEPGDIAGMMAVLDERGDGQTARLLCGTALGARIKLALATLDGGGAAGQEGAGH